MDWNDAEATMRKTEDLPFVGQVRVVSHEPETEGARRTYSVAAICHAVDGTNLTAPQQTELEEATPSDEQYDVIPGRDAGTFIARYR